MASPLDIDVVVGEGSHAYSYSLDVIIIVGAGRPAYRSDSRSQRKRRNRRQNIRQLVGSDRLRNASISSPGHGSTDRGEHSRVREEIRGLVDEEFELFSGRTEREVRF